MSRHEHVLTVFVASPSDVGDERTRLEEVIAELNIAWSRNLGVRLELVRWETHAFPGFGDDAQAVINEEISEDYDVFIGIMWCRYGTATNRAGSGTEEEFARAKQRYDRDSSSVKIMFYFKDAPVLPSELDPEQLAQINAFRSSIGEEGALYWTFSNIEQFEKLLRLHLTRQLQAWLNDKESAENGEPVPASAILPQQMSADFVTVQDEDDEGILDLMDVFDERLEELTTVSERIGQATEELGEKLTARGAEMNQAKVEAKGDVSRSVAKRLIAKAAGNMDQYVARMDAEIPAFGEAISVALNALLKVMALSLESESETTAPEEIESALSSIREMKNALKTSEGSIEQFRTVVVQLPRLTSILNKSKRAVANVLDRLIVEFQTADSLANEAEAMILKFGESQGSSGGP